MPQLTDNARASVWAAWMRTPYGPVAVSKAQLRAAVDAADDWAEAHFADFTAAIPAGIRTGAAPLVLLANSAGIARGAGPHDVAAGIADRDQAQTLLAAYNAASAWLTTNVPDYLAAVAAAGAGGLGTTQALAVLEAVCRQRAM